MDGKTVVIILGVLTFSPLWVAMIIWYRKIMKERKEFKKEFDKYHYGN